MASAIGTTGPKPPPPEIPPSTSKTSEANSKAGVVKPGEAPKAERDTTAHAPVPAPEAENTTSPTPPPPAAPTNEARVQTLQRGFKDSTIPAVFEALQAIPHTGRQAVVNRFNALPADQRNNRTFQDNLHALLTPSLMSHVTGEGSHATGLIALLRSDSGFLDNVGRLHMMLGGNRIDRAGITQLYSTLDADQIAQLQRDYAERHGQDYAERQGGRVPRTGHDVENLINERFGVNHAWEYALALRGKDPPRKYAMAAQLAGTATPSGSLENRARLLGEMLQRGNRTDVERAYGEMFPGEGAAGERFTAAMRDRVQQSQSAPGGESPENRATRVRIEAALNDDVAGYVAHSAQQLGTSMQRQLISESDARAALGMVDGKKLTWAQVEARAKELMPYSNFDGSSTLSRLLLQGPRRFSLDAPTMELARRVTGPDGVVPGVDQTQQPAVRAARLDTILNSTNLTDWTGLTNYRREGFSKAWSDIPLEDRRGVEQAYRERTGHSLRDDGLNRFSGIAQERFLADLKGPIDDVEILRFASRGEATPDELAYAVASGDVKQRATLMERYLVQHPGDRGGRDAYQEALSRLRGREPDAARLLETQVNVARLSTPEQRPAALKKLQELFNSSRGDYQAFTNVMMDQFMWSGQHLDISGRNLFGAVQAAQWAAAKAQRTGQPVPEQTTAALSDAIGAFRQDYERLLHDRKVMRDGAATAASTVAMAAVAAAGGGWLATGFAAAGGHLGGQAMYSEGRSDVSFGAAAVMGLPTERAGRALRGLQAITGPVTVLGRRAITSELTGLASKEAGAILRDLRGGIIKTARTTELRGSASGHFVIAGDSGTQVIVRQDFKNPNRFEYIGAFTAKAGADIDTVSELATPFVRAARQIRFRALLEKPGRFGVGAYYFNHNTDKIARGVSAHLGDDGFVEMGIFRGRLTPAGPDMFEEILETFGSNIKGIRGKWLGARADQASNYDRFMSILGPPRNLEQAAFATSTGQWASDAGFNKVKVTINHREEKITAEFTR